MAGMNKLIDLKLKTLYDQAQFSELDYYFATFMARAFNEKNELVTISCALVSKALSLGHICLDLNQAASGNEFLSGFFDIPVKPPTLSDWKRCLNSSSLVSNTINTPIVLDNENRLYLSRYFDFQSRLAQNISCRLSLKPEKLNELKAEKILESGFSTKNEHTKIQQKAVKHALSNPITFISGGPGTGKTYVTTIIKQAITAYALAKQLKEPKIISVAPTGKAASKMDQGRTIHSVLKPLKNKPGFFHNRNNPLVVDVMIIDEASMIDIVLMTRLLEAVPLSARVIITGDRHQLSSIQAGSVFNDICRAKSIASSFFFLDYNFRSKGKTGIECLSRAINDNNAELVEQILTNRKYSDIVFEDHSKKDFKTIIQLYTKQSYEPLINENSIPSQLRLLDDFKILCAQNSGEYGTLLINHLCENVLRSTRNFGISVPHFCRMIMIKVNDYKKALFNGDTGIVIKEDQGERAYFKDQDNRIRTYRTADLPRHDPAFAITIHKSQGSEFNTILIVIPDYLSPVLTRQLLYTGVTRAKKRVVITGQLDVIKQAVAVSVNRRSGLIFELENRLKPIE